MNTATLMEESYDLFSKHGTRWKTIHGRSSSARNCSQLSEQRLVGATRRNEKRSYIDGHAADWTRLLRDAA